MEICLEKGVGCCNMYICKKKVQDSMIPYCMQSHPVLISAHSYLCVCVLERPRKEVWVFVLKYIALQLDALCIMHPTAFLVVSDLLTPLVSFKLLANMAKFFPNYYFRE